MRPRDFQKSKVYKWGWDEPMLEPMRDHSMSLKEIEQLAAKVCGDYGRSVPRVEDGRSRRSACGGAQRMAFPRDLRNFKVAIHELAHVLAPKTVAAHGPEYMRIYIDLLARYGKLSVSDLATSARRSGVKISSKRIVKPIGRLERMLRKSVDETAKEHEKAKEALQSYLLLNQAA